MSIVEEKDLKFAGVTMTTITCFEFSFGGCVRMTLKPTTLSRIFLVSIFLGCRTKGDAVAREAKAFRGLRLP